MTPEEKQIKTREKVKQVQDLCAKLELVMESRQRVILNGFIESIINFIDTEQYPDAPAPTAPEPEHVPRNDEVQGA